MRVAVTLVQQRLDGEAAGQFRVDGEGLVQVFLGAAPAFLDRPGTVVPFGEQLCRSGHARPGIGIVRDDIDGPLVLPGGQLQRLLSAQAQVVLPLQVEVVGVEVHRSLFAADVAIGEMHLQRRDDGAGNLILDSEYVIELPVVGLRPEVVAVFNVDELGGNPYPGARLAH